MPPRIARLFHYPVKSLAGVEARELELTRRGPAWDREWMLVNDRGIFLTQRQHPRLCLVRPTLEPGALRLDFPDETLRVPLSSGGRPRVRAIVWKDACQAVDEGPEAAEAFTQYLGLPCRLVRFASAQRAAAFADEAPVLLASLDSLADLNARLPAPLGIERFRPNVVVEGAAPFAEDAWKSVTAAGVTLRPYKPCSRCGITTIDPKTGATSDEPLRTLAGYRRSSDGKVLFAMNARVEGEGTLRVGDAVATA